jgi:hypothetical protein
MAGKINAGKPVGGTQFGTTIHDSKTHAPTLRGSSTTPKGKIPVNGVVSDSPHGTTFPSAGKEPFDTPDADKKPRATKVVSSGSKEAFVPKGKGLSYGDNGGMAEAVKNPPVKKR